MILLCDNESKGVVDRSKSVLAYLVVTAVVTISTSLRIMATRKTQTAVHSKLNDNPLPINITLVGRYHTFGGKYQGATSTDWGKKKQKKQSKTNHTKRDKRTQCKSLEKYSKYDFTPHSRKLWLAAIDHPVNLTIMAWVSYSVHSATRRRFQEFEAFQISKTWSNFNSCTRCD